MGKKDSNLQEKIVKVHSLRQQEKIFIIKSTKYFYG